MWNKLCRGIVILFILGVGIWGCYVEYNRHNDLNYVRQIEMQMELEQTRMEAVSQAQEYAGPIVELAGLLAKENTMFTAIVDKAKKTVIEKSQELRRTQEALNHSVKLLKDQIEENNRCVEHIRKLEAFARKLLARLPEEDRPEMPTFEAKESDDGIKKRDNKRNPRRAGVSGQPLG